MCENQSKSKSLTKIFNWEPMILLDEQGGGCSEHYDDVDDRRSPRRRKTQGGRWRRKEIMGIGVGGSHEEESNIYKSGGNFGNFHNSTYKSNGPHNLGPINGLLIQTYSWTIQRVISILFGPIMEILDWRCNWKTIRELSSSWLIEVGERLERGNYEKERWWRYR